jgi:hypothetical protein
LADFVAKAKSNNPKNLAKVDPWTSSPLLAFQRRYGGP